MKGPGLEAKFPWFEFQLWLYAFISKYLLDAGSGLSDWGLKMNTCAGMGRGGNVYMSVSEHARIDGDIVGNTKKGIINSHQET